MNTKCPACGAATSGRFCRACGAALNAVPSPQPNSDHWSWFLAGGATALGIAGLVLGLSPVRLTSARAEAEGGPPVRPQPEAAAPDISALSPRERFDRLFDRIMRAAENGDEATVTSFAPMAIAAYTMLDSVDVDARYHLALIQLHSGGIDAARAQGDSIQAMDPRHLFGFLVHGAVARYQKDQLALDGIYRGFLANHDAELRRGRPEYRDHARALDHFADAARTATTRSGT